MQAMLQKKPYFPFQKYKSLFSSIYCEKWHSLYVHFTKSAA